MSLAKIGEKKACLTPSNSIFIVFAMESRNMSVVGHFEVTLKSTTHLVGEPRTKDPARARAKVAANNNPAVVILSDPLIPDRTLFNLTFPSLCTSV